MISVPPTDVAELMTELHISDANIAIEQLCIGLVGDDMEVCLSLSLFSTRKYGTLLTKAGE